MADNEDANALMLLYLQHNKKSELMLMRRATASL